MSGTAEGEWDRYEQRKDAYQARHMVSDAPVGSLDEVWAEQASLNYQLARLAEAVEDLRGDVAQLRGLLL